MYKQGVRKMPRCIKKELASIMGSPNSINSIIPIEETQYFSQEEISKIVKAILSISGLPSFWLVSIPDGYYPSSDFLVFEKKLNPDQAKSLDFALCSKKIYVFDPITSCSDYYGIY